MVEYWLVFNLMISFIEVLIHTYEVTLRTEEQEVNHHGRTSSVGKDKEKKSVKIAFSDKNFCLSLRNFRFVHYLGFRSNH